MPDQNLHIVNLTARPDLADTCAAWSFGEWGSQTQGRTLQNAVDRYRATAAAKNSTDLPLTWMIIVKDRPAGMISLKQDDHPDHKELSPWLASLYIHPEYRQQGLAIRLVRYLEDIAKTEMKIERLHLFTHTAARLYKQLGWTEVKKIRDPSGLRAEGELLFVKDL